jgi:hypothetical protein
MIIIIYNILHDIDLFFEVEEGDLDWKGGG